MTALQFLRNADLKGALSRLQSEVRDNPSEPKHRIFLFQLLAVLGQWDRALTQLNVVRDLSAEALSLAQSYQETLNCEALRAGVFSGLRSPLLFGEPEQWMALVLEALKLQGQGRSADAVTLREQALELAPILGGSLTLFPPKQAMGEHSVPAEVCSFEWIADADSSIGPFLEAIINGKYFWVPFQRIQSVAFERVADLRDLVWLPARFEWTNGGEAVGFIPTRYAGSESVEDDHIRMAWKTVWDETSPGVFVGRGLRVLTTDVDEYGLTQIAKIEFQHGSN